VKGTSDLPRVQVAPSTAAIVAAASPTWKTWVHDHLTRQEGYSPAFYTDGAYKEQCSVASILHPRVTVRDSAAAMIIKDNSISWKNKPVFAVHMAEGADVGTQSAFSMEYLALAMAMTTADGVSVKPVVSDAKAVLNILPDRKAELRNTRKKHSIPLAAMDRLLDGGARLPMHVKAHPEKHKPDRTTWTADDWGNFMADRAAAKDWDAFRSAGIQVIHQTVPAGQVLEDLLLPGQWYLSNKAGNPISLEGLREVIQKRRFHEYITTRDDYRLKRGDPIKWKSNTMEFAAEHAGMEKLTVAQRAVVVRRIWDKGWHGGNRCKDPRYKPDTEEYMLAQACDFCGDPDSADHWMQHCQHGPSDAVRQQTLLDINEQVMLQKGTICGPIAQNFQHLLHGSTEPARMWTGNFNDEQCEALQRGTKLVLSTDEATAIKLMLKQFMKIIHTGASVLWFTKIQHHGPAEVKVAPIPVVPTTQAMVAMLNPVMKLGTKAPKALKKKRSPLRPAPITAAAQLAELTAVPFIGPVQRHRKLVLPRPDPLVLQGLSTALATCAAGDILLDVHNLGVQARSFCTLLPGVWLDDQIIHAHLALLQMRNPRTMYLNLVLSQHLPPHRTTFDYDEVRHMYRTIALFDKDLILMPINITNTHWTLIAMDIVTKTISYYDSMRGNGQLYVDNALAYLRASAEARGLPFNDAEWTCDRHAAEAYPAQPNSFDCGIYVLMVADLLTARMPVNLLTLEAMARSRTHISMCLWEGSATALNTHAPYVFAPTPAPTSPTRMQARLSPQSTALTGPPTDSEIISSVLKSIITEVVKATRIPAWTVPMLAQTTLLTNPSVPPGLPTDSEEIRSVLNAIVTRVVRAPLPPGSKPKRGRKPAGGKILPTTTKRKNTKKGNTPYETLVKSVATPTLTQETQVIHDLTSAPSTPPHDLTPSLQPDSPAMSPRYDLTTDPTTTQQALTVYTTEILEQSAGTAPTGPKPKRKYTKKSKSLATTPSPELPIPPPSLAPSMSLPALSALPSSAVPSPTPPYVPTTVPTMHQHDSMVIPSDAPSPRLSQRVDRKSKPRSKPRSKHVEPVVPLLDRADRGSRNKFAIRDARTVRILTSKQLTRLRHLAPETCELAIGPSQQYDGGQELYLNQPTCTPGTTIAYYDGTLISAVEADKSTSKYIFKLDAGDGTFLYIDAEDPMCSYARYADDSLYDGTENAHWVPVGTGADTRLSLVATRAIKQGEPIRACYGWEYWYEPNLFTKVLMRQAFEGYIHYIRDDEEVQKAWAYAKMVGAEELLLAAWNGVRRDLLDNTGATHAVPSLEDTQDSTKDTACAAVMETSRTQPNATNGDEGSKPHTRATEEEIATRTARPDNGSGPARKKRKTSTSPDIRAHFAAVTPQSSTKTKRARDAQVRSHGEPSLKKLKARAAIPEFLSNFPWQQGTKRKRARTLLEEGAAASVGGAALSTVMNVLSGTFLPPLHVNVPNNCLPTRAPYLGPSLTLVTIPACGSTASTELTHLLPVLCVRTQLPVGLAEPVDHVNVVSLSSLPLGTTTISNPLNER